MTSVPQTQRETTGDWRCDLPRWKFINTVLINCREAAQANRPRTGADLTPAPFAAETSVDQFDRERAIGVAEGMGLKEGEATELADSLRDLGASTDAGSLVERLRESDLDQETLGEMELVLRNQAPSAEETMHALRAAYSCAYHQWERHADERGWPLYSGLIPGLINPVVSLGTGVAKFAATKLVVDLARIFGRSVDGYEATRWIRILDPTTVGAAPSLRAVAVESGEVPLFEVGDILLEAPEDR
jgi:hypothetical protein